MRSRCLVLLLALIIPFSGLIGGTLTITKDGGGDGFVRVNGVDQTLPFSQSYASGTSLTLEAVPADSKSQFMWWSGYVNSTDNPVTFSMPLFGNASIAASFSLSPPYIGYSNPWISLSAYVGYTTYYDELEIHNWGGETLVVVSMSITGPNASEFFIANVTQSFNLVSYASRSITIGFIPVSSGEKQATLTIISSDPDPGRNPLYIELDNAWGIAPPDIASNPADWDFGLVIIGGHSDKTFAVRNNGDGHLTVESTMLTGSNASEFTILDVHDKFALDPGASRDVTVRFAPTGTGSKSATLTFNSNDPDENPFHVGLAGTGIVNPGGTSPDIASSPASWDYGAVNAGSSLDKTFVISNAGAANLNVTAVTLSGADASEFHIQSGGEPFTLAPAATRNIVVRFAPAGSGGKSASLSFVSNDPDENPFLVHLSGGGGTSIVVDGNKDSFYSTLTGPENGYIHIPAAMANDNGAPADDQDLSADLWLAWDDTYLYVYEEVRDDVVHLNNPTTWQNDCLEIYFDPDPSLGRTSGPPGFGLSALDSADTDPANYSGVASMNAFSTFHATRSDYARRKTADGYALECRVKWDWIRMTDWGPVVPGAGKVFGMAVMNHDNDVAGREGSIEWSAALKDAVWNDTRLHGTVTFLDGHRLKLEARNAIVDTLVNPLAPLYVPNALPWPMLTLDVGSVQKAGSAFYDAAAGAYTVSGSGANIWDKADGFQYAFQQVSGDVEYAARIVSLTKSDPWTKGALMIRDGLTGNSAHAMMAIASDNGLTFQYRTADDATSALAAGNPVIKPPYWLKIVRSGNTLIGSASADGASWVEVGRKVIALKDPVYAGMAVTSHKNGSLSIGTFSDVTIKFKGVTGIEEIAASGAAPQGFALSQNYPNPFNPVTCFTYDLPRQAMVKIMIYDVMGREVETLVNGMKPAGMYTIEFDGSGLGSGIFFCDMQCDGRHIIRKMMLLK